MEPSRDRVLRFVKCPVFTARSFVPISIPILQKPTVRDGFRGPTTSLLRTPIDLVTVPWRPAILCDGKAPIQFAKEGKRMIFMMKRFGQASRRGHSRPMGRGAVSCEILEGRRLLSTGMQMGGVAGGIPIASSGRWQSRWADMATMGENTVASSQVVSNLGIAGLGADVQGGTEGGPALFLSQTGAGAARARRPQARRSARYQAEMSGSAQGADRLCS